MKMIQRYLADDGREFLTEQGALEADRHYRLSSIYNKHPLWSTDEDNIGHVVPVEALVAWLQKNPKTVVDLAPWLAIKVD